MGRTIDEVIAGLPKKRQERISARYHVLKDEVKGLRALRKAAGKVQGEMASSLKISQPSVSKIEKQTDMYLSTLRNYIEAVGGDLELVVRFPKREPIYLTGLGEIMDQPKSEEASPKRKRA